MPSLTKFLPTCLTAILLSGEALSAQVKLPYGTFVGLDNYTNDTGNALANPLIAYLNIPYAAPPTGPRRFARPEPPLRTNTTVSSTEYGPICPQSGTAKMDEDCLSLAVFAPKGTDKQERLPVVIWIHGGAFNGGSKQAFSLASMVSSSPVKYIGVSINYRLGALGFLPSNLTHRANSLNLGLYDQRYAIEGDNETATFSCLRGLPVNTIRNASVSVFNKYDPDITWPFQPVVDHEFTHQSWESGQINNVSILTGFNSDEGSGFVPKNLNTTEQFKQFFKNLAPTISDSQLDTVANLYPGPDVPGSPYANSPFSPQFPRIAAAYGDFAYIAQVQANAVYASKLNLLVWKYHFAYLTPNLDPALGVVHASELPYVSTTVTQVFPGVTTRQSKLMNAYWSSFIVSGDPNKANSSAPAWPQYTTQNETQIKFSNGTAYTEPDNIRRNATDFWRSIPDVLMH
ncbi:unnamed protein product [Rhizoctonia solani]|uniref:Carboxylesterase type B domain-containing protein n=1 Tax=Rhizoctonia solani TaxID=456999 RepID=A0A8H2WAS8_9AGAM|nr:unnamed protein product [Rhizoctonia solani]